MAGRDNRLDIVFEDVQFMDSLL